MKHRARLFLLIPLAATIFSNTSALAQGCVAAHSNQRSMDQLVQVDELFKTDAASTMGHLSIHNLTVDIGYRVFNSNKYFVGDKEIPRANATENHQNIFNIGLEYRFSPRWSLIADIPIYDGTRNQLYPPSGVFQVS